MTGELNRCLEAGMDGLLTKPLEVARLREVLKRHIAHTTSDAQEAVSSAPSDETTSALGADSDNAPIDITRLRALVGEDEAFARELCHTFIGTAGEALQKLDIALASGDRAALASSAHRLKGGSQSICADRIARLAQALEYGAQSQSLQFLEATLGELRNAISECAQFLGERLA